MYILFDEYDFMARSLCYKISNSAHDIKHSLDNQFWLIVTKFNLLYVYMKYVPTLTMNTYLNSIFCTL